MELPVWLTVLLPFLMPHLVSFFLNTPISHVQSVLIFFTSFVVFRYLRLYLREYSLKSAARKRGASIPPLLPSALPFGLSNYLERMKEFETGTPDTVMPKRFQKAAVPGGPVPPVIRSRTMGMEVYLTTNHADMQYILATAFPNWGKPTQTELGFNELLGEGVFNTDQRGSWKWHRGLTRPHFARDRVADIHAIEEQWARANNWLATQARAGRPVDIQDLFIRFTLTAGTQHLFGKAIDSLNELTKDQTSNTDGSDVDGFASNFHVAQTVALKRVLRPEWLQRIQSWFCGPDPATQKVLGVVDQLIAQQLPPINDFHGVKKDNDDEKKADHDNLVLHLLSETSDIKMIRHECLNILLAARDTTASLLTSAVYELGKKPELWEKCRDEVITVFGSGQVGLERALNVQQVRSLKYLKAVLNESLRLHPPVWLNSRMTFEDDVLPSGYFIPKHTICRYAIRMIQRDPSFWGPDAEEFVPERWIDDRRLLTAKDPFRFQPFSAGPRICLGQQFAYTEASIAMIRLMQRFTKVKVMEQSLECNEYPGVTSSFRNGMWVELTEQTN